MLSKLEIENKLKEIEFEKAKSVIRYTLESDRTTKNCISMQMQFLNENERKYKKELKKNWWDGLNHPTIYLVLFFV